jgi:tripartite-type tricarboxylate transporter receptor subunit TctC
VTIKSESKTAFRRVAEHGLLRRKKQNGGTKMFMKSYSALAAGAFAVILGVAPAAAQTVEEFYKGKEITIISPFAPGGTTAGLAIIFSEELGKHIPGNPTFKIEYMPGAGGMIGQNFAYNQAPKDGTALFLPQDSSVVLQKLEPDTVKYDAAKINWLGNVVQSTALLAIRKDTGIKTWEDLKNKEVFIASSGAGSETDVYPRITNGVLGTIMKVIPGYTGGSSEGMVAVEKGEAQGIVAIWRTWSSRPDLYAQVTPVLAFGNGREPNVPDVPNLIELATTDDDKRLVRFISSIGPIGRALAAPPEVPEDRVAALRTAFAAMLKDPSFLEKLKQFKLDPSTAIPGEELQKIVTEALDVSPAVVERARVIVAGSQ